MSELYVKPFNHKIPPKTLNTASFFHIYLNEHHYVILLTELALSNYDAYNGSCCDKLRFMVMAVQTKKL